jgi:hypothetical protein
VWKSLSNCSGYKSTHGLYENLEKGMLIGFTAFAVIARRNQPVQDAVYALFE